MWNECGLIHTQDITVNTQKMGRKPLSSTSAMWPAKAGHTKKKLIQSPEMLRRATEPPSWIQVKWSFTCILIFFNAGGLDIRGKKVS